MWSKSCHTLQDVPVYAHGPGSAYFGRSIENIEVFFGMAAAIGLDPSAEVGMATNIEANTDTAPSKQHATTEDNTVFAGINMNLITLLLIAVSFGFGYALRGHNRPS